MKYLDLLADAHWALLREWLVNSPELLVDVLLPSSPSSSSQWLVRSLEDIQSIVASQDWPQIVITIYRNNPYFLRGVVDEAFTQASLQAVPDNTSFSILSPERHFPDLVAHFGGGENHSELIKELSSLMGVEVIVGVDPDPADRNWIYSHPEEAMQFEVRKSLHA